MATRVTLKNRDFLLCWFIAFNRYRTLPDIANSKTLMRFSGSGTGHSCQDSYFSAFCFARPFLYFSHLLINSTEVQNPWHNLDGKYLCLPHVFGSVLTCANLLMCLRSSLTRSVDLSLITFPQTLRLFYVSLHSQAPQQQYIVKMADLVAVT